jgi:hypothetical protein
MRATPRTLRAIAACSLLLALGACDGDQAPLTSITAPPEAPEPDPPSDPDRCGQPELSAGSAGYVVKQPCPK